MKAFNVLSAYSLESGGLQGSKQVRIVGDGRGDDFDDDDDIDES